MGAPKSNGLYPDHISLAESHEDRIQVMESSFKEVLVLLERLQNQSKHMSTSLDDMVTEGKETNKEIVNKLDEIVSKVDKFEDRLTPIEAREKLSKQRSRALRNIIKGGVLALVAAIATGAGAWIWEKIIK